METTSYAYDMTLTSEELDALLWASNHGYDGGLIDNCEGIPDPDDNGEYILQWQEHKAWEVNDNYREFPNDYGACIGGTLLDKMMDFIENIV